APSPRYSFYSYYRYRIQRDLHSFPTRRSSDLAQRLKREIAPYENRVLLTEKLKEGFHLDPQKLSRTSLVSDASAAIQRAAGTGGDRKSTRLNSSHVAISYAVFCLKKKKQVTRI